MNQMQRVIRSTLLIGLICATASFAAADDMVANPQYDGWAKFKPGTSVTYSNDTDAMGQKTQGEMTMTLIDLTPEKATIELKGTMTVAGNKHNMPAQQMDIVARVPKDQAREVGEPDASVKAETKQGAESIDVGGKSYACKWTEVTSDMNNMKTVAKTWLSDTVPGKMVKMEATTTTGQMNSTTKMTLVSVETK